MAFTHGTYTSEVESAIKGIVTVQNPVVVVGTAPINMGDITCVNKAQLIQTTADATKYFGGINNIPGFTISEALYTAFQIFGVTPVICINVLDPEKHKTEKSFENIAVVDGKFTFENVGIISKSIVIKNTEGETELKDFKVYFDSDGKCNIQLDAKDKAVKSVKGSYNYLDPTKVEDSDIIGSVDPSTLKVKGLECLGEIFTNYSMIPSYVITPGYNSNEVRAILDTKATTINGKYSAMSIVDMPETTKYGEAIKYKKENNWIDEDQIVCFGKIKFSGEYYNQSTFLAMLSASIDANNNGVPYQSPSNNNIKAEGIGYKGLSEYEDIILGEQEANLLNENGICTVISRPNGIVSWGNRTSCYQPGGNTDPKDAFIPVKRMFKYIANNLHINCASDVDKPMTFSRAKNIQNNINIWLSSLIAQGKLLGGRVEFTEAENSQQDLIDGKFKWHIYLGAVTPGETLHFVLEYDGDYVKGFFS